MFAGLPNRWCQYILVVYERITCIGGISEVLYRATTSSKFHKLTPAANNTWAEMASFWSGRTS